MTAIPTWTNMLPDNAAGRIIRQMFFALLNDAGGNLLNVQNIAALVQMSQTMLLTSGGLRIKGGAGSPTVNAQTAFYGLANAIYVNKAANTDMAALSGTVANGKFNVFFLTIDQTGTLGSAMGTVGNTLAQVVSPTIPATTAIIGMVIINPTGTGNFVGGTTNLDDATVVPNAVFINTVGDFNPSLVLSTTANTARITVS